MSTQSGFGGEISKEAREAAESICQRYFPKYDKEDVPKCARFVQEAVDRALSSVKEAQPKGQTSWADKSENFHCSPDSATREAPTTQEQPPTETGSTSGMWHTAQRSFGGWWETQDESGMTILVHRNKSSSYQLVADHNREILAVKLAQNVPVVPTKGETTPVGQAALSVLRIYLNAEQSKLSSDSRSHDPSAIKALRDGIADVEALIELHFAHCRSMAKQIVDFDEWWSHTYGGTISGCNSLMRIAAAEAWRAALKD